ncbi:MAG: metallophosphoesterase [Synergistaceae bacterium]|nr:metallophosphoesterase [Synergistaceae bacterium]
MFVLLLLTAAFKDAILRMLGGGVFFTPDLPRWVIVAGSLLFNFLVVAAFLLLFKDTARLLWKTLSFAGLTKRPFPNEVGSWFVMALASSLSLYGTWEAVRIPDVTEHDVYLPGLSSEFDGTRVVLLVDLHASSLNRRPFIQSVVEKVNALSPDVVLIPGDFVDGPVTDRRDDLEPLSGLKARMGVWGTSGNHEYYSGYGEWKKQLTEFGVTMLENEHIVLTSGEGKLVVAGIPDPQGANPGFGFGNPFEAPDVNKALDGAPDAPVILSDGSPSHIRCEERGGWSLASAFRAHPRRTDAVYFPDDSGL